MTAEALTPEVRPMRERRAIIEKRRVMMMRCLARHLMKQVLHALPTHAAPHPSLAQLVSALG
jgi:hypothetical protein